MWLQLKNSLLTHTDFYKFAKNQTSQVHSLNKVEFRKIAQSCALGFAIMGGIGYVVKLLFIPINNIILSWLFYNFILLIVIRKSETDSYNSHSFNIDCFRIMNEWIKISVGLKKWRKKLMLENICLNNIQNLLREDSIDYVQSKEYVVSLKL